MKRYLIASLSLIFAQSVLNTPLKEEDTHPSHLSHGEVSEAKRRILAPAYGNMRIYVDFTAADKIYGVPTSNWSSLYVASKQNVIQASIFHSLVHNIINPTPTITFADISDKSTGTTFAVKGQTVPYDLYVMFLVFVNDSDTTLAWAASAETNTTTGRPISGKFALNMAKVKPGAYGNILGFGTYVHEFYHILAMNSPLYPTYIDANGQALGDAIIGTTTILTKPGTTFKGANTVQYVKTYLNDPSVTDVPFEVANAAAGGGSAGAHWEYIYWPSDFMSSTDTVPNLYTNLSWSMSRDTGWYTVNWQFAADPLYGKGVTGFQSGSCPTASAPGFCASTDSGNELCGLDYTYKGSCGQNDPYSLTCYFLKGSVDCTVNDSSFLKNTNSFGARFDLAFETYGAGSRCGLLTISGNTQAQCGLASCDANGAATWQYQGVSCTCSSTATAGTAGTCTNSSISIKCPLVSDFCNTLKPGNRCPNDCSSRGVCVGPLGNRQCFCMYGYTGYNCNTTNPSQGPVSGSAPPNGASNSGSVTVYVQLMSLLIGLSISIGILI